MPTPITPKQIPSVIFKTCARDANICDAVTLVDVSSDELFRNKRVVLFALPGAFTPTCTSKHLPGYEACYEKFRKLGIDEVICLSVNDAFVMHAWAKDMNIKSVYMLSDGSGTFTKEMNMLVKKDNLGFGDRSWRYSMYVDDGEIQKIFIEEGFEDNHEDDPFEVSDAHTMWEYLKSI